MNRRMTLEPAGHEEGAICLPFRQISGFRIPVGLREHEVRSNPQLIKMWFIDGGL